MWDGVGFEIEPLNEYLHLCLALHKVKDAKFLHILQMILNQAALAGLRSLIHSKSDNEANPSPPWPDEV